MNPKSEEGLYDALRHELKKSKDPLDCATLFDMSSIREHATTVNRVSDYLGNLWRKGEVLRLPAPRLDNTRARWLYMMKPASQRKKEAPDLSQAVEFSPVVHELMNRPHLAISEEGNTIVLTTPYLTITIKQTR